MSITRLQLIRRLLLGVLAEIERELAARGVPVNDRRSHGDLRVS